MTKILIADDSAFMRKIVTDVLKKAGYTNIVEASNADEAIEKYKKEKPDMALLDIIMGEKDGVTALKEILVFDKKAKVVMLTAVGQETIIKDAQKAGCKGYIIKPFKEESVIKTVKEILAK